MNKKPNKDSVVKVPYFFMISVQKVSYVVPCMGRCREK